MFENLTVNITVDELEKLVKEAVEKQFGKTAANITFNMEMRSTGYGMNERDEEVFTGVTVKLVPRRTEF